MFTQFENDTIRERLKHRRSDPARRRGMTPTIEHCKLWFADPANARKFFGNFDIQENGCQLWRGPFFEGGHGLYTFDGAHVRVHRLR